MLSPNALPIARHYRDVNHPPLRTGNRAVDALRPQIEAVIGRRSIAAIYRARATHGTEPMFRVERGTRMTFAEFFGHLTDIASTGREPRLAIYADDDGKPLGIMVGYREPAPADDAPESSEANHAHEIAEVEAC